ncbi:MAG: efflux RND transporter periplasmic adaptor subunit, partial [Rubripirellula sp.]
MPNASTVPHNTAPKDTATRDPAIQETADLNSGLLGAVAKVAPTLFVLAVMAGGWWAVHEINTGGQPGVEDSVADEAPMPDSLTLPAGKIEAAKFETVAAQMQPVEHVHTIPGRIRYDETRHVDVKAPMDGILAEVFVTPGEHVESGQLLAVLRSPEIGQARAEILKRQNEREIAQQLFQRELSLANNLEKMSAMLDQGASVDEIENAFRNRSLGSYRQGILSSYAKMQLSSELLDMIEPLANSGSVSGRSVRERQAERQMAETEFRTARDQATFAANQAKISAEAKLSEADRQLNLAWQSVET